MEWLFRPRAELERYPVFSIPPIRGDRKELAAIRTWVRLTKLATRKVQDRELEAKLELRVRIASLLDTASLSKSKEKTCQMIMLEEA